MRIDDVREIDPQFLEDAERVLVTAGASAPEDLVQQVIAHLQGNYNANIEVIDAPGEAMEFALPATMRKVLSADNTFRMVAGKANSIASPGASMTSMFAL